MDLKKEEKQRLERELKEDKGSERVRYNYSTHCPYYIKSLTMENQPLFVKTKGDRDDSKKKSQIIPSTVKVKKGQSTTQS